MPGLVFCPANAFIRSPQSFTAAATAKVTPLACTTHGWKAKRKEDDYPLNPQSTQLNSKGRFPRKSLGQHYMLNASINEELVAAANVKEGDIVLESGPGTGSLTNVLVNAGATVLAIEKDPHMAVLVRERFAGVGRVKVVEEDFARSHMAK